MDEVSVIVPIYQAEQVIIRCVDSILEQTFGNFELVLVDDGSTDRSGEICDSYAHKDGRVIVVHKENEGVSSARNAGLDVAKGKYILFVDSDDYLSQTYIQNLYHNRSDLTICGMDAKDERGGELYSIKAAPIQVKHRKDIDYPSLYKQNVMYSPYCKLFCNEIVQQNKLRFPLGVSWGEDGMFVADYLQYIDSLTVIEQGGYNYVKYDSENTLSTKVRENIIDTIVTSREYCFQKMKLTSPERADEVCEICQDDIRHNCAYFIISLLVSTTITRQEKIHWLELFMRNQYVMDTLKNPEVYYFRNPDIIPFLKKQKAKYIVNAIQRYQFRCKIIMEVFRIQPQVIKKINNHLKRVVKR